MQSRPVSVPLFIAAASVLACALSCLTLTFADPAFADEANVNITPRAKPAEVDAVPAPRANIRIDTTVVLIPVTVTDPLNRFVTGLDQDVFKVFEDKIEQKIVSFGS
jgi:hypothetical protein